MATAMRWFRAGQALAVCAATVLGGATALAQNNTGRNGGNNTGKNKQPDPTAPLVERLFQRNRVKQYVLSADIYYPGLRLETQPIERYGVIKPGFGVPNRQITSDEWNQILNEAAKGVSFETAAMVFPVPLNSSSHFSSMGTFKSWVSIDDRKQQVEPQFTENYQAGERLARWELRGVNAKRLNLHVEIPVTCWETVFNEQEAVKVDWPKGDWPAVAKTALEPVYLVDYRDSEQEIADNRHAVDELVKGWLAGRDPKTIPPVVLAKELAGRVMERCTPGDGETIYGAMQGTFFGLITRTSGEILAAKRCLTLDPPVLLSAVYRSVGLPARTVYGLDMSGERGPRAGTGGSKMTAWVEFAVSDPRDHSVVWVPVDVIKLRRSGSRMQKLDRPWKYFGGNEDLAYSIPISFHAHPPTGVVVRSLPAFWGWLCTPETPPYPHSLKIDAMTQNSRQKDANDESDRQKP